MMRVLDLFSASGTLLKRLRAELRVAEPHEPSPEVEAFFARNVRPGGPIPPKRPGRSGR
jgi:hypothetical protein